MIRETYISDDSCMKVITALQLQPYVELAKSGDSFLVKRARQAWLRKV